MNVPKIKSTTQDFTEIVDIVDDIVLFHGGNMCSILEVAAVNFYLLSQNEQEAKLYGYVALLNSLALPIQILVVSKKVDIASYLDLINQKIASIKHPLLLEHLKQFRDFIKNLIKGENLLDKKIYVVIPFSTLELGPLAGAKATGRMSVETLKKIKTEVGIKRNHVVTQLFRIGLASKVLHSEELVKLFYELFNGETLTLPFSQNDVKNIVL